MPKLTEGFADKLIVPVGARDVQVFDDDLPGFGIRKFDSGKASYFVKFNVGRQQRRKTLGAVVRGNLKAMRLEASAVLAKARLGMDVVADAKAAASRHTALLGDLVPKCLEARKAELRPKSYIDAKRYLERTWKPLHGRPIDAISRQDVVSLIDSLDHHKVTADRARMALSAFYSWAIDRGYCDTNPTMNIRARAQNAARTRVLTEAELVTVWKSCEDHDYGHIVKLLILTGQRRREIGDLAWPEIDFAKRQIELPEHRTKNGRPHVVPLCDEAIAILKKLPKREGRDLVFGTGNGGFSCWSAGKDALDARALLPAWVLHDVRRSFVTHVSEQGFAAPHVVEAIVNHISGAKAGVAGVYNRASYLNEKRQALELWGAHVAALVDGRTSKVVALRAKQKTSADTSRKSAARAHRGTSA